MTLGSHQKDPWGPFRSTLRRSGSSKSWAGGGRLSFNALSTPPIGTPSAGAGHTPTRSGRIRNRHSHNQRRKRGPAAMAVTAAFAPALDVIVTATTAVTIRWIVGVACVRISPAVAVNPGVPPSEARRSRRSSRNGKTGAGNRYCRTFPAVPHELDPLRKSHWTGRVVNVQTCFSFFMLVCFFSWREPRAVLHG